MNSLGELMRSVMKLVNQIYHLLAVVELHHFL